MSTLCIFEDDAYLQLYPLAYTRPVYDLVCGMTSIGEKILRTYGARDVAFYCRPQLAEILKKRYPGFPVNGMPQGECLFINGRILSDADLSVRIPLEGQEACYVRGETLVASRLKGEKLSPVDAQGLLTVESLLTERRIDVDVALVSYPWELVDTNSEWLQREYQALGPFPPIDDDVLKKVNCVNRENVFIGNNVTLKPGVVLDAESGPIYIDDEAIIFANAVIEGPVFIGRGTQIKPGALISGGTYIGPVCKIGGEVEGSIILGYSNKQHDGYLGHSYLGSWVNLGAGTTNSDLKNNYHPVKVQMNGHLMNTGSLFVGLIMGDHSKSGINSMFNTGTVVGVSCNVFGAGFPPRFIPSFSWCDSGAMQPYRLDKAVETARTVMARRERVLTEEEEVLLRHIYEITADERRMAMKA